jgi:hypothetical protein
MSVIHLISLGVDKDFDSATIAIQLKSLQVEASGCRSL